jgi:Pyridoxamine 5'-phosphate oxidase
MISHSLKAGTNPSNIRLMFKFEIKVTLITTMTEMSKAEIVKFLMQGTLTGKIATVKKAGSSHVAPIWFVLDKGNSKSRIGNVVFTTGSTSVKAKNIWRYNRVSVCGVKILLKSQIMQASIISDTKAAMKNNISSSNIISF